jgi:two-component system LytT family response regulator
LNIAICDDETEYANDIRVHLNQYSSEHGLTFDIYDFNSGEEILASNTVFDIAFLDIEMDGINGIEVGRELQKANPDLVLIYVTAYNHYLDDALDLGITRFFDKPIDSQRFYEGMDKAISKIDNTELRFYLKDSNKGVVTVRSKDIIFVEIIGRKTKIHTKSHEYLSKDGIKIWKARLNKSYFEIPHNSYIINTNFITYYCKDYIMLDYKYNIPIAFSKRSEFKRKFMKLMGE